MEYSRLRTFPTDYPSNFAAGPLDEYPSCSGTIWSAHPITGEDAMVSGQIQPIGMLVCSFGEVDNWVCKLNHIFYFSGAAEMDCHHLNDKGTWLGDWESGGRVTN